MKLLTITVPCYNSEQYLKKCIDSLLTGGDQVEIIIINDGSTDNTGVIADAYSTEFPNNVKVIHQPNGGHGEGINQGILHATGRYFKVVDSDDWVGEAALKTVLNRLEELEAEDGIDLLVTNYVYEQAGMSRNRTIRYRNVFPDNKVVGWEETMPFLTHQYLTIHSIMYRTELLRNSDICLPKHLFYEDNYFVYKPLPLTRRLLYLDIDLYHYQIGREGQSVEERALMKRYTHQIKVAKLIFESHDLSSVKEEAPKLGKYMYHEARMMLIMATAFARLNKTQEAEEQVIRMWNEIESSNPAIGRKIRYRSNAAFVNKPGRIGRTACISLYRLAQKVIRFNNKEKKQRKRYN